MPRHSPQLDLQATGTPLLPSVNVRSSVPVNWLSTFEMHRLFSLLALCCAVDSVAYPAFPPVNMSADACLPCTAHLERESMLTMISEEQMCGESLLYGLEVSEPFLSRAFTKRGVFVDASNPNVHKKWAKTWQMRTMAVQRANGTVHHVLLPFILDPTGYSTLVGPAAVAALRLFGAAEHLGEEVALCHLSVALPIQSESCAVEYDRAGSPSDLRDNMVGEENAQAIFLIDSLVSEVLDGNRTREDALNHFMHMFQSAGAVRSDSEREFDLTLRAPVVTTFPPSDAILAILVHRPTAFPTVAPGSFAVSDEL